VKATAKGVARAEGSEFVTVQLRGNDRILAAQRVRNDEVFELMGTLEAPSLRADNVFQIRAVGHVSDEAALPGSASDGSVQCAPGSTRSQVLVELDPASVFEGTEGTAVEPGFERFPQAFAQGFDVRLATLDVVTLSSAASMVQLLQRGTSVLLRPRATVGALTGFDGLTGFDSLTQPTLAVSANSVPIESMGQAFAGIVPPTGDGASLIAAVEGRGVDHLLLAAGPGGSVGYLPSSLLADLAGLRSLRGDLIIERAGVTRNIRVQTVSKRSELPRPQVYEARVQYPLWFGFLLGVVIALLVVMSRHRRQHP
jgi:hypothetical protein